MSTTLNSNSTNHKIALLATGNELTDGDIANSNGQRIAQILKDNGFELGMHIVVSDDENEIVTAGNFLLQHYDFLITIGGLGPTSDDRTRFALSQMVNKKLIFDEASWRYLSERILRANYPLHDSNRQQALFPEGSEILVNRNGTANGCSVSSGNKWIFMLPGPPNECLPMFNEQVLPKLLQLQQQPAYYHFMWRLFGVSESEIAATLDNLLIPFAVITGYRCDYPYVDFKVRTQNKEIMSEITNLVEKTISPYLIASEETTASEILRHKLESIAGIILINDQATGGLLQYTLSNHWTREHVHFIDHKPNNLGHNAYIEIKGLDDFWQDTKQGTTGLTILFQSDEHNFCDECKIPFRSKLVINYAVELICRQISKYLAS